MIIFCPHGRILDFCSQCDLERLEDKRLVVNEEWCRLIKEEMGKRQIIYPPTATLPPEPRCHEEGDSDVQMALTEQSRSVRNASSHDVLGAQIDHVIRLGAAYKLKRLTWRKIQSDQRFMNRMVTLINELEAHGSKTRNRF